MARRRIPRRTSALVAASAALTLGAGPLAEAADLPVSLVSSQAVEINTDPAPDGFVGPGDVIALTPTIRNDAGHTLSGLTGRLILPDDGSILQNDTTFGTVADGTTRAAQTPFQVALVTSRECGRPLRFRMTRALRRRQHRDPLRRADRCPGEARDLSVHGQPTRVAPGGQAIAEIAVPSLGPAKTIRVHIGHLTAARLDTLSLTLRTPAGDVVPLIVRKGGASSGLTDATFVAAGDPVPAGQAGTPLSGAFQSEGDLGALDGATMGGQWQLILSGTSAAQVSDVLGDWDLQIADAICQPQMIASITPSASVVSVGGTLSFDATDSLSPDHPITRYRAGTSTGTA